MTKMVEVLSEREGMRLSRETVRRWRREAGIGPRRRAPRHRKRREAMQRHLNVQGRLQLIVLPFEDDSSIETERLERCPNAFVFYDPVEDAVNWAPVCAWGKHKKTVMRKIAGFYAGTPANPPLTVPIVGPGTVKQRGDNLRDAGCGHPR